MPIIKKLFYRVSGLIIFLPSLAAAQWDPNNPNYIVSNLPRGTVYGIIYTLMLWLLGIFGFVGVIGFVISGIMYLTSAGNETQIENAKKAMKWSFVGVIVGLSGLVILRAVSAWLTGNSWFYF